MLLITSNHFSRALFANEAIDAPSEFWSPPPRFPKYMRHLKDEFTYGGRVVWADHYLDESDNDKHWGNWTERLLDAHFNMIKKGTLVGGYGLPVTKYVYGFLRQRADVKGEGRLVFFMWPEPTNNGITCLLTYTISTVQLFF